MAQLSTGWRSGAGRQAHSPLASAACPLPSTSGLPAAQPRDPMPAVKIGCWRPGPGLLGLSLRPPLGARSCSQPLVTLLSEGDDLSVPIPHSNSFLKTVCSTGRGKRQFITPLAWPGQRPESHAGRGAAGKPQGRVQASPPPPVPGQIQPAGPGPSIFLPTPWGTQDPPGAAQAPGLLLLVGPGGAGL